MNKFDKFLADNNGKFLKVLPNNLNPQCFDLCVGFTDLLGVPHFPGHPSPFPYVNAYEIYTRPNDVSKKYFDFIPNSTTAVPQKADIIIWDGKLNGGIGHVAVATGKGDTNKLESFDQNWVVGSPCKLVTHDYKFVLGWLRFKGSLETANPPMNTIQVDTNQYELLVKKATNYDSVCQYLQVGDPKDVMFENIQKVIAGIKSSDNSAKRQVQELGAQLAVTQQEVKNREEQVSRLKTQLTETVESYQIEIEALKNKPDETSELVTNLRAQVVSLEGKYEEAMKEKGSNLKDLAEAKKNLDICIKSGPPSKSLLDFILDLLKRIRVIS